MYSTPLYYEHLTNTYYLPLTTDPRNPKPILPELLIHYLLLYNLSMISRYETDWWYDLLGSYSSEDYPFIYQFLSISAQKSLTIFQIFINGTKSISWEIKNTSQMTCVLVAWRRPTLTGTRSQLPSALESLTSVFGMGTGVTSLPSSPNYEGIFLQN